MRSNRIVEYRHAACSCFLVLFLIHISSFQNLTPVLPAVPLLNARLVMFTVVPLGTVNINIIKINFIRQFLEDYYKIFK